MPVEIIYPDQRPDELGTLFIPNTLSLIKDSPPSEKKAEKAARLFVCLPTSSANLANGPGPLRFRFSRESRRRPRVKNTCAGESDGGSIGRPAAAKWDTAAPIF